MHLKPSRVVSIACGFALSLVGSTIASAQDLPEGLPRLPFHLTARPWQPLNISADKYLDAIEGDCRFTAKHLDAKGAVIDPVMHKEWQYSTPYFAFGVGVLVHAGRANDLLEAGVRAMDHATECFSKGDAGIPEAHGEFFLASLPSAVELYQGHVPAEKIAVWRERLRTPREQVVRGGTNNWRAYAMKGEWIRAKLQLADMKSAKQFVADNWIQSQQQRIAKDKWNLYEDGVTDPESHAVEAVGRGNLLALVAEGYDGKYSDEILQCVERGTAVSLLLQDPSGQCPPNGRTDDHVFNDVLYQLCFDVMAERAMAEKDMALAGQYRHAAMLSFKSIERWRRRDEPWAGSYYITKNHFDPAQRVGYQPASQYSNYNGAVIIHLAEAYLARKTEIPEQPAPVEIGGYAFTTDGKFATAVADAGGMQMFASLRGDKNKVMDRYWTSLGVERFGRVNWDTRLGPSDGERDAESGRGVSFAPTWQEDGKWIRMADVPDRYRGKFSVQFAHPLLVRCAIDYAPIKGPGPTFRQEFVITPDGILATTHSADAKSFGVTWPLLEDDGAPLRLKLDEHMATTSYGENADEQALISLDPAAKITGDEDRIRSSYGWLRPVRAMADASVNHTFIYPRNPADPSAENMRAGFKLSDDGFDSPVGHVHGSLYVGPTSAGGEGKSISLTQGGTADIVFDQHLRFIVHHQGGKITAVEADKDATAWIGKQSFAVQAYVPLVVK